MMELFLNPIHELSDPTFWNATNTVAVLSAAAAVVSVALAVWPMYKQRRTQQLLERDFGSELYDPVTIENSTRYYVSPNCSSVDPSQEAELRHVVATEEGLFEAVDKYLMRGESHRHILLLADSGMGKSSFVLNYYARNQKRPPRKRLRLAVVPLSIPDADAEIARIPNPNNTIIFLDALDEDTNAIQDHRKRLAALMDQCRKFKRVLITCRTQFFPSDEEIPRETGIARFDPRKPGEAGVYEFWKLYLSPLNDKQVRQFLRKRYRFSLRKRKRAQEIVNRIPLLSVRPMLLAYTPDLLDSGADIKYSFQLYEVMVEKWLERERSWVDKGQLRAFSEWLAQDIYVKREQRGTERIPRTELLSLAKRQGVQLEDWKITGRSLLNRDAQGNFKFAHRSIMEYLCVIKCIMGDLSFLSLQWTDQMKMFMWEALQAYAKKDRHPPFYHVISTIKEPKELEQMYNSLISFVLSRLISNPSTERLNDSALKIVSGLMCLLLNVKNDDLLFIVAGSAVDWPPVNPPIKAVPTKDFFFHTDDSESGKSYITAAGWLFYRLNEMTNMYERISRRSSSKQEKYTLTYTVSNEKGELINVIAVVSKKIKYKVSQQRFRHVEQLMRSVHPLI